MKNPVTFFRTWVVGALLFITAPAFAQFPIQWTNLVNTNLTGSTVTKTGGSGLWDGTATSQNFLETCQDGCVEFTVVQDQFHAGFYTDCFVDVTNVNAFLFSFEPGGLLRIFVPGTGLTSVGSYSVGDRFKICRSANTVTFYDASGNPFGFPNPTTTITNNWCFGTVMRTTGAALTDAEASFSDKSQCVGERDWMGANTGNFYHTYLNDNVGIGTKTPTTKLDVDGDLRVRGLTQDDTQDRMLAADSDGNVFWRDASTLGSGSISGAGQAGHVAYWSSPTELDTSLLKDNGSVISLGNWSQSWGPPDAYYFHIYGNGDRNKTVGLDVELFNQVLSGEAKALVGNVQNNQTNTGVDIFTANGTHTQGGRFVAQNGSSTNTGGFFSVTGSSALNYGISATLVSGSAGSYAGVFNGTSGPFSNNAAFFNGLATTMGGNLMISDQKFKENVEPVEEALSKILAMQPTTYSFKGKDAFPHLNFPEGTQYGFIAQELEEVVPEVVLEGTTPAALDEKGFAVSEGESFKGVNYTALIPLLTAGIQEQQRLIEALQTRIEELETHLDEAALRSSESLSTPDRETPQGFIRIRPNPTSGPTSVDYRIAGAYEHATLVIYDATGTAVHTYELTREGSGTLEFDSSSLVSGTYFCHLLVNGQTQEVRKFIVIR